jgi:hypothetical protein
VSKLNKKALQNLDSAQFSVRDRSREQMTRAIKAALLSGLIFPGIGHMVLKQYLRGSVLMLSALAALSVIVTEAINQALTIVDRMNSGEIPVAVGAITELGSMPNSGADDSILSIAAVVVSVVWIIGIVDSYRLGIIQEK